MPDIIVLGELLVEVMREKKGVPHTAIGEIYRAPYPSGAPAIFASSAARMAKGSQLSIGYIGVAGNDDFGQVIIDKLKEDGVDTSQIRRASNHTGAAFVQYNTDGSRKFIFMAGAAGDTCPDDVHEIYFKGVKAIHIMGSALSISPNSRDAVYKMLKIALKENPNVDISFDPNLRPEMLGIEQILKIVKPVMEVATVILPSGEEAEMLAGVKGEDNACKKIFEIAPRCKMLVLKQGSKGATAYEKSNSGAITTISAASYKVDEVDATGAGDSFGGAFMVEYLKGIPVEKALKFANAVGALKVTHFGPIPSHSKDDVEKFLKKY
jgi:sugar/nucleoside kinase (ribokinase family)